MIINDQDNAPAVAQIIQRLDGIPLAIELAAARLRMLSAAQIALRLNDAFRLLTGGARTALPRHQTLQALIDWSYNLLSEAERQLLRSLSVFAGGWTLEAAEEVGGGSPDILDLLSQLADKSLIMAVQTPGGEMRYRMLETIRQYAHTRLIDAGEAAAVRTRHLAYYLRMAETLEPRLRGREQIPTLDYWETELDNLRLALEWALQSDIEAELRLAASLQWFWHIRYLWAEGISWLDQGLETEALSRGGLPPTGSRTQIRAKALTALGFHSSMRHGTLRIDFGKVNSVALLEEALALYRTTQPEDRRGLAWVLVWLGGCKLHEGDSLQARVLGEEALSLFRLTGGQHGMAECAQLLGDCEIDPARQKKLYLEQLALDDAEGDIEGIATALVHVGMAIFVDGDYGGAIPAIQASMAQYRQVGNPAMIASDGLVLAFASHLNGDLKRAALLLEEALAIFRETANDEGITFSLFWKGMLAFAQGRYNQVTELIEEISHIAQKTGHPGKIADVLYHRARLARLDGDSTAARQYAQDGLKVGGDLGAPTMRILYELGHLALQDGDLGQARIHFTESLQVLIPWRHLSWGGYPLDGLAVLAVREGKHERAARLFGTRQWRGFAHTFSPIERAERDADFTAITHALGAERFAQLQAEGLAMPFMQILALAQE